MEELAKASGVAKNAAKDWRHYGQACRTRAKIITGLLTSYFSGDLKQKRVLDWGCATGGVAIILDDELPVKMSAADVDEHSIRWLTKCCPSIEATALVPAEALPFDNDRFDAIFGISVFTHIPPDMQEFYLKELKRIIAPGGVVILTVKSESAVENARATNKNPDVHPHQKEQLDKAGIMYSSYPENVLNNMDFAKKADYGITYHSRAYIDQLFGQYFDFVAKGEQKIGQQDVLVLKPKT